jgi:hypothetical protein
MESSTYTLFTSGGLLTYGVTKGCSILTEILLYAVITTLIFCVEWSAILAIDGSSTVYITSLFRSPRVFPLFITIVTLVSLVMIVRIVFAVGDFLYLRHINTTLLDRGIDFSAESCKKWKVVAKNLASMTSVVSVSNGNTSHASTAATVTDSGRGGGETDRDADLEIRVRLLRRENYKVAILTDASLDLPSYTKPVEWILDYALWDYIFQPSSGVLRYPINEENMSLHSVALKKRLKICAILYILLSRATVA